MEQLEQPRERRVGLGDLQQISPRELGVRGHEHRAGPGTERRDAAVATWERLRSILEEAVRHEGASGNYHKEIEPMRTAAVLRPQNEMKPEITLRAHVTHKSTFEAVTPGERDRLAAFEKKLVGMGLRAGHW